MMHFGSVFMDPNGVTVIRNMEARSVQEVVDTLSKDEGVKFIMLVRTQFLRVDRVGWAERLR
jgi:hypothetical protein